jgi:hypothetical protein
MDDMDAESEELGGRRKFFTGDYARYGWAKLMAPSLGGHEVLNLYGEGISKMPENPGIPALFRDIFKNAYLPYRDPETLKAFLKIIDEFSYDHSERLGDAFEYAPDRDLSFIEVNRFLRQKHPEVVQEVISQLTTLGVQVERNPANDLLILDRELVVSLVLSRCLQTPAGSHRWLVRFEESHRPDITIVARMDESNHSVRDYYLFPALDQVAQRLRLAECNNAQLDTYRFDDLGFFYSLTERIFIEDVA